MKPIETWRFAERSLQKGIDTTLLYVLESKGSSPGRQGFFMVVTETGAMEGSIGGGIMEHKFVQMVKERLRTDGKAVQEIKKQFHNKSAAANQSGMICSGEQTILLLPLRPKDLATVQEIIASLENHLNGTLILSTAGINFEPVVAQKNFEFHFTLEKDWLYKEKTGYKNKLFIIGGGHCALALSVLMRGMDFYITLFEERTGLNTIEKNVFAHEIITVDDYTALGNLIPSGAGQYVIIMTVGYRTDDIALRSLLNKKFDYLGVLGSKTKMEKLFADYKKDGIAGDLLQRIHTPAGLAISSETPEEIAVSIAAEIIRIKNQRL